MQKLEKTPLTSHEDGTLTARVKIELKIAGRLLLEHLVSHT